MALPGIDLLDLDRFQRLEHHDMFKRLRAEEPVSWHEHPKGQGFWNVVTHKDLLAVNRDVATYSSEVGGVSILGPDEIGDLNRHRSTRPDDAVHGPAQTHALPAAGQQGLHSSHDRDDREVPQAPRHPHRRQHHRARIMRLRRRSRERAALAGDRRDHGRAPRRAPAVVRLVEPHDRRRRSGIRQRRRRRLRRWSCSCT